MNRARLRELTEVLATLDAMDNEPNKRGLKLESFVCELLGAHGFVSGTYVSTSGFTAPAQAEAREHARDRVVVRLDRVDVLTLLRGHQQARELHDERIDDLVRRYES